MGKVLSCFWSVSINGTELSKERRESVDGIEFSEVCDGSDTCTITVNDPDFHFIEDNIFIEEATILINIGWHDDTHRITFAGYIAAIDISFPDSGFPVLSLFCIDTHTHLMNRSKKSRSWDNVTSSSVVQKIAQEYGLKCVVESGYEFTVEDTLSQSNVTDIEFCESLAGSEREPFMCKVMDNTLYYVKKGILQEATTTLYYKKFPYDIISFNPKINKETRQEEVTKADINTNDKSVDSAVSTDSTTARDVQGEPVKTSSTPTASYTYNPETREWG